MAVYIRCLSSWAKRLLHSFPRIRTAGHFLLLISVGMIAGTLLGGSQIVRSMKTHLDYEPLFSILDDLRPDGERRYWIELLEAQEDTFDIEADRGQGRAGGEILYRRSPSGRRSSRIENSGS